MNDAVIRNVFKHKMLSRYSNNPNVLIIEELGLRHGTARIDIAVINSHIHGYELKSDMDTLVRLPAQSIIYNAIFDKVTIILAIRHVYAALQLIPDWWGVKMAEKGPKGGIHFYNLRRPRNNPSVDKLSLAQLLWREEAIEILDEVNTANGFRDKSRDVIYRELCKHINSKLLRSRVCQKLKLRLNWRVG